MMLILILAGIVVVGAAGYYLRRESMRARKAERLAELQLKLRNLESQRVVLMAVKDFCASYSRFLDAYGKAVFGIEPKSEAPK